MEAEGTGAETVAEGRRILAPIHLQYTAITSVKETGKRQITVMKDKGSDGE
jgi:hypothetical protein